MDRITVYYTDSYDGKTSHELLSKSVAVYCGVPEEELVLVSERSKKPYFTSPSGVHFSISHSDSVWACAFASEEVGLDVQVIDCKRNPFKLSERYFHGEEADAVKVSKDNCNTFARIWARKEAVVKLFGVGIDGRFKTFSSVSDPVVFAGRNVNIKNFDLIPAFSSAIAYCGEFEIRIIKI